MGYEELKITWDEDKNLSNITKHNISFEEAATVFRDQLSITRDDPEHSQDEERFATVGLSAHGRLMVISHTLEPDLIRIISARKPTAKEREDYES